MAKWSYSGDPSKSDLDKVRFLVRDTNPKDQLLQDAEINFLIQEEGSADKAAIKSAENIAMFFARKCDESVGKVSRSFSQKHDQYLKMAKALRRSALQKTACPFSGALDITQKEIQENQDNRVQPAFTKDIDDFRRRRDDDHRNGNC